MTALRENESDTNLYTANVQTCTMATLWIYYAG